MLNNDYIQMITVDLNLGMVRPKKKICLFPISDRPYQNMCDPNLFYGFPKKKKKKKKFFFFFFFFRKSVSLGMSYRL